VTVLEVIQRSAEFLAKKSVESPRLQVELLLAHLLEMPRMKLYLNFERVLTETELEKLRAMIKRRGNREPLQHIVGTTNFCGLDFHVNQHVLIPRPETEILAERAWDFLLSLGDRSSALDFGTGSGCLAVLLATKCSAAKIDALDLSADALATSRENAKRHKVLDRIEFYQGNGFAALPEGKKYNLIVANPPYIPSAEIPTLEPEVNKYDPKIALDGGIDGLDFYRVLAKGAVSKLVAGGKLMMEFGEGQADAIRKNFEMQNWIVEAVERDYSQRERFLIARRA
jgi:release factor glutamine methyltransferase